ncbi:zinc finger CCHC domain-containing protein 7 [Eucyclogobius newberryi]|uniref:zinc finger CCHC domain-containing protein 7 n=1 Tax=Eucyclogobius newberryi TaxID=166745 RepID=UPI003B5CC89D
MYSIYQYHEQLEDELYREEEDDSERSEAESELEFHLYSQLHYSSNAGEVSELEDKRKEMDEISTQDDNNATGTEELGYVSENHSTAEEKETMPGKKEKKKTKSVKDKPKSQRASSTFFEEVIVIDSSPDVITVSEDDSSDEEEGVCASKGRRLPKLCTSTPAQQVKKSVIDAAVPVNVSSTDSESESESQCVLDSSSSSDSDDLENWMILGPDQQEGDKSISLNLDGVECETDTEDFDGTWLISDKDIQAQINNRGKGARAVFQRMTNRYYTDKNVHCKNCNKTGHLSKNCPEPKKLSPCFLCGTVGHVLSTCPYKHCNNCGLPGHLFNSCSERVYWHKQCRRCGMTGHFHDDCPEVWRQYHITIKMGPPAMHKGKSRGRTPAYCYNCSKKGHFGHECHRQRMFNGTYPCTPFINHYDNTAEIKVRQNRMEKKVKDLKNNGLIPKVPQSPSTPGPRLKKQKSFHQQKETASLSYKTNLPVSSHIFFSDASVSKTSKQQKQRPVSTEKPWKPKRPVPQSRDALPKAKVVLDEADDFPRGGGEGEEMERKKKGKKMKKNGQALCWTEARKRGFLSEPAKKIYNQKKKKKEKNANKNMSEKMYPTDENLFIIKQRKRKR